MQASHVKTTRNDLNGLIREAQDLFRQATTFSGVAADDLRSKGISALEAALDAAQTAQAAVLETGKEAVAATDEYVQANPWKAIAISTGVGLALGLLIASQTRE